MFVTIELLMLWMIRDDVALNALMLLWPIDAVQNWQAGGTQGGDLQNPT